MTAAVAPTQSSPTPTDPRGPAYPRPGTDPKLMVRYVQLLLQDGDQDATARYRQATQYLLFADGRQQIDWNLREKAWKDAPSTDGRIRVTMNYIRPILRSRTQRLMSSELSWRAVPRSNSHEERDRAAVATNLIESRWRGSEMDAKVRYALFLADCCGVAYLKQFWNPTLGQLTPATLTLPHPITGQPTPYPIDPQGQPLADDQGNPLEGTELGFQYRPGDTDTAVRTLFNIRINPDAQGLEPNEGFRWLLDTEVVPLSVVKERWGERAAKVTATAGVGMMRQYERIVRSIANRPGSSNNDLVTGRDGQQLPDKETTLLVEYWEAPSESMKRGRLLVVAGDELLFPRADMGDEEGLPQGVVPHVAIYSERRPLDAGGRAIVSDLIAPQKVINTQWGAILEEQALNGPGQWAMFDIPGLSDQVTNLSAAHIKIPMQSAFANRGISDLIQRINPGQSSPDRWRMLQEAKATMFDIGAFHEIQRGQVPPGVDSGIAVQLLQEAENGQMHDSVRGLKQSLIQWGRQTGKLAKWGYGEHEERWIPQQRQDLGYLVESVTGADLPDFDTLLLDLEGFRPNSQAAFNAEIKEAMAQQWIDPRRGLQLMDLGRGIQGAFESQGRHYSRARRENLAIQRDQAQMIEHPPESPLAGMPALIHPEDQSPFLLPSDDDHLIHIDVHQEIGLDDTRPWPERQVALMHINEHRLILQAQMQPVLAGQQEEPGKPGGKSEGPPSSPAPGTSE